MLKLILALVLGVGASAQTLGPATQLELVANAPQAPTDVRTSYTGPLGSTTYYYWVLASYPAGGSPLTRSSAVRNVGTLSASNTLLVSWRAVPGVLGYVVLRTETPDVPINGCLCIVNPNVSTTFLNDDGSALSAYTNPSISGVNAMMSVNNTAEANPYINLRLVNTNFRVPLVSSFTNGSLATFDPRGNLTNADSEGTLTLSTPLILNDSVNSSIFKFDAVGVSPSLWIGDVDASTPAIYRVLDGLFLNANSGFATSINFQIDGATAFSIAATGEPNLPPQSDEPADCANARRGSFYFDLEDERLCICVNDGTDFEWVKSDDYSHATGHCSI